ncbi:O-methyltransferase [Leminorella grimontii]|uniref:O-methyltransferase n=1 Tax=Leminorella grimontii TaxID=82981 RepID=A0AAV5N661_9GAMM|nr:methyltransferase [Leminorella grimontii]KFC93428.1 SAM-dependent methyltransferase [Leminorella grimontii ATCC 33999 = DSM 5078]GKX55877.1 O-methyltransferase [Leminorella grimontii]VFS54983.1 Predicted O-methyltransferase [Leminorella grimontii]
MSSEAEVRYGYDKDSFTAFEAITEAQKIAFAPMLFQAALNLRDSGVLAHLDDASAEGATIDDIADAVSLSRYAIQLLLDVGLSSRIVFQRADRFFLGKVGHFLLHDKMTRVNMDFSQDVCYQGMFHLKEALSQEKPAGLRVFGDWSTIYPALSQLPEEARKSWFAFDHFYSDAAFSAAFKHIFPFKPKHIYDVGGNTGKWALCCARNDENVKVTLLDLPQQIELAKKNVAEAGLSERIDGYGVDLLQAKRLPGEADMWWMSQFLDCFSEEQVVHILKLIHDSMDPDARVCIMEVFWDRQPFEAGALSLNASSLYFTCMANGNSRFYHSRVLYDCLRKAGFYVEQDIDNLGLGHTLLICKRLSK